MIPVTKSFLPPIEEYNKYIADIWERNWLTNNGPLVNELELKLKEYLGLTHILYLGNGTIALQIAIKALSLKGEIITTPFSYVATTGSIVWEGCQPVFVDIDKNTFNIDADKIEASITSNTTAILATHVYGYPCDVDAIENIALKHNLKVIYDAAHAFGTIYNGKSIFNYGDISTCSFHATKIFHTGEGGCVITNNEGLDNKLMLYRQFGHVGDDYRTMGINGKNSEFHAAMGLCNLKYIDDILQKRKEKWMLYYSLLKETDLQLLDIKNNVEYNYAYFPVVFSSEAALLKAITALNSNQIFPRRYFYPSLNTLNYIEYQPCPVAEDIAKRILCLPIYYDLSDSEINFITSLL